MLINIELGRILDAVWKGSQPYVALFQELGLSFVAVIVVVELLRSAWDLSTGRGWHFSRTLTSMLVLGTVLAAYPTICRELWSFGIHQVAEAVSNQGQTFGAGDIAEGSLSTLEALWSSFSVNYFGGLKSLEVGMVASVVLLPLVGVVLVLLNIAAHLVIFGHFMGFLVLLLSGFVFLPFLLSSDLRQIFLIWLNSLVVYLVTFLSFRLAITICAVLNQYQQFVFTNELLKNSQLAYMFELLFIPLVQVLVLFRVPGMIRALVGYGGGAGGGEYASGGSGLVGGLMYGATRLKMLR